MSFNSNDKLVISFTLPYQYFIKPLNCYHESIIKNDWRIKSNSSTTDLLFSTNLINPNNVTTNVKDNNNEDILIFDNFNNLKSIINTLNESYASFGIIVILNEFKIDDFKLVISIIGDNDYRLEMNDIKLKILQSFNHLQKSTILIDKINNEYCYNTNNNNALNPLLINFISNVSNFNKCSIFVENDIINNTYLISIIGFIDQVKVTESKINLFIDDLNPLIFSDYLELNSISILPLICGNNCSNLNRIKNQSNTNIYLPNLLPELYYNNSKDVELNNPKILITGLRTQVLLAKKWLSDMIKIYTKNPFIKTISILPLKREFLILEQSKNSNSTFFNDLMLKHSCYLSIPTLGIKNSNENSQSNSALNTATISSSKKNENLNNQIGDIISIQGNSIEEVENLIDDFTNKISTYYSEKLEFTLSNSESHLVDINKLLNFNDSLAFNSNCLINCSKVDNKYIFQILGNSENIKIATNLLTQFNSFINEKFSKTSVQYQIELPNKEKNFIAGKKNGKIIKIINMSQVQIKLLPFNDDNFIVEISGNDLLDSILGLGLFEDELPTIYQFNVPESFHRQIIGVGGQTIQIIMRKFNVFVKFSNSFELSDKTLDSKHILQSTNFQQSFIRKNNVIIKCPSKNKSEIPLAKIELEKLVEKVKKNSYSCTIIKLSIQQWNLMTSPLFNMLFNVNRKKPTNFITELEKKTNTFINYPSIDSIPNNQDLITLEIYGIENNSKLCSLELKKIIPYSYEFKIKKDNRMLDLLNALKFANKLSNFKINELSNLQIEFLEHLIVITKMFYNLQFEIKIGESYDHLIFHYYPNCFGFEYNIINTERLSIEKQTEFINMKPFNYIPVGVIEYFNKWNFQIIGSGISNSELIIEDYNPTATTNNNNTNNNTNNNQRSKLVSQNSGKNTTIHTNSGAINNNIW